MRISRWMSAGERWKNSLTEWTLEAWSSLTTRSVSGVAETIFSSKTTFFVIVVFCCFFFKIKSKLKHTQTNHVLKLQFLRANLLGLELDRLLLKLKLWFVVEGRQTFFF